MTELNNLNSNLAELNLTEPIFSSPQHRNQQHITTSYSTLQQPARSIAISRYYANVEFNRMQLSETVGANIKLNSSRCVNKNYISLKFYFYTKKQCFFFKREL